ncbi:carbohydrate-binding protein [Flammeovirga aprica]|uniref:CBM6 domain-containing protein n=1 Tax=Flammeovirga aprica JL-4 TaxID=694437 RepID=A0A7X9X9S0_9BACT|nr:hypothetical protein [Flammeovirga aprica]NME69040.1 hypothetical protein [Flammeovirga aprica JL-4]
MINDFYKVACMTFLMLIIGVSVGFGQVYTMEAEDADLTNAGVNASGGGCANKSGSGLVFMRGTTAGDGDRVLAFNSIDAPSTGKYTMKLTYFASKESKLELVVNGGTKTVLSDFELTGFCYEGPSNVYSFEIDLNEGANNTITMSPVEGVTSPYLDKLEIFSTD